MVRESFRFAKISTALSVFCLAILSLILLYPFDFAPVPAGTKNSVEWLDNGEGVRFGPNGMLVSDVPPTDLYRHLISGKGLTIELWLSAASSDQEGPARIVSYSINPWERNFTVGQEGNNLVMRLRTTNTGPNGRSGIAVADAFVPGKMQHVVVTYDYVDERLYVDGKLRVTSAIPGGNFGTWDPSYYLVFGNEFSGGRPWDGTIAYAALYDRPLSGLAVEARSDAGYRSTKPPAGLLAAFNFSDGLNGMEGGNAAVGSSAPPPLLTKPPSVGESRLFLSFIDGRLVTAESTWWDLIRNVILFLPFGVIVFAAFVTRGMSSASAILLTVIGAGLVSATFEALQYFLEARLSSIFDFGTNTAGALLGALGCWYCFRRWSLR